MLRLSADLTETKIDPRIINDGGSETSPEGVLHARELVEFAEAVVSRDETDLRRAENELLKVAGQEALVDTACVAGNFQRMVRIADATGIPIDAVRLPLMMKAVDELGLKRFESAKNTPSMGWLNRLTAPLRRKLALSMMKRMDRKANGR